MIQYFIDVIKNLYYILGDSQMYVSEYKNDLAIIFRGTNQVEIF